MSKNSYLSCLLVLLSISANKGECDDAITFQTDEVDKTHMQLAVSPNGQILATGGYSKQVTLWDVKTQKKIAKLDSLNVPITSLEFSPDGLLLVTGAMDKTLRILSLETKRQVRKLDLPGNVCGASFSPDGRKLALSIKNGIEIYIVNVARGEVETVLTVPKAKSIEGAKAYASVAFSPNGKLLVTAVSGRGYPDFLGEDSVLSIWDAQSFKLRASLIADKHNINDLAISPDSQFVAGACARSKTVKLWKLDFPEIETADSKQIEDLVALLDDDSFENRKNAELRLRKIGPAAADALGQAIKITKSLEVQYRLERILDSFSPTQPTVFADGKSDVHSVAFSPDGKLLASGRQYPLQGHVVIRNLSDNNRAYSAPNLTGAWVVKFLPDGSTLVSLAANGEVTLWNVKSPLSQGGWRQND